MRKIITGMNSDKPILDVEHKKLIRVGVSPYRSDCPVCKKGILPVTRHSKTYKLLEFDRCLLCGQRVRYTDIQEMRMREGL